MTTHTIFASVIDGKVQIEIPAGWSRKNSPRVREQFSHDEKDRFRAFCQEHRIEAFSCSSSIDWAEEDDWPETTANEFLDYGLAWQLTKPLLAAALLVKLPSETRGIMRRVFALEPLPLQKFVEDFGLTLEELDAYRAIAPTDEQPALDQLREVLE